MIVENITINQDIITNTDISINALINNMIVSVGINEVENYYHQLIRQAVLQQGVSCCENEQVYNKLILIANENPVNFSDPV